MASNKPPGVPFSPTSTPKYLNDFSKALASEVRILLQEVGKLRDERRALQHEIAELMAVKAKHSAGGEGAHASTPGATSPSRPAIDEAPIPDAPARPGWRVVHKRPEPSATRRKGKAAAPAPAPPPPPPPVMEAPRPELPSWAQWRPNPNVHPVVRESAPSQAVVQAPPRQGLFGPVTPPPS
ncbi:hypothetical protein BJV74DRAFT_884448 [Russula compacta]|nr:hypothetical protein BJV74DRAFT_884448 [Russula compacta]